MQTRRVVTRGGQALEFTRLGLGGAPLGDLFARLTPGQVQATFTAALAAGVGVFDTAPHYGNGLSELRFGAALREVPRDGIVVSTKIGRVMDPSRRPEPRRADVTAPGFAGGLPHRARFDYSYDGTLRSVEQSLLRTGLDRFDVLLIHDCDVWTQGADDIDRVFGQAMEGAYPALDRLRRDGVVAAIGIGVNEGEMCARFARAGDFDVMMLAGRYSLLEQPALESFLPLAEEKGIAVMLAGVFNSGILATGPAEGATYNYAPAPPAVLARVARIEAVCLANGVTLRQAALAFPLGHPAVATLVLGAVDGREVEGNVADLTDAVPPSLWSDLKAEKLLAADAPVP